MLKFIQPFQAFFLRLSKREKFVFYGALFFISLTLLDQLIVSPIFSKIKFLDTEIRNREVLIKNSLKIVTQKERILSARDKYSYLSSGFTSSDTEVTSLLKEIEGMSNKSSVYLVDMKPAAVKGGSSEKFMISLSCEAQMEQLVDFMYNIENSDKLLMIEKYQISPKSKESSVAKCNMSISKIVIP